MNVNRHVVIGTSTLILLSIGSYFWYTTFSAPIEVGKVELAEESVAQGEKLKVYYRYKITRTGCVGTMIGEMHDGIETVRVYEAPIELPEHVLEVKTQTQIGLPAYTKSGKARLDLRAEFVCNKVNQLDPIKVDMGHHTFNVVDADAESKSRSISTLRAQMYDLNIKVINLTVKVQQLEKSKEQKTYLEQAPLVTKTDIRSEEQRLSVNVPQPKPNIPMVEPSTSSNKRNSGLAEERQPYSLYTWVREMIGE